MARLFITQREMNFISDITKEIIKDVGGQVIYYYPINELKTAVHGVYNEAIQKVFDNPIKLDCFVDTRFQEPTKINEFGVDSQYKIEAYVQYRDLVEKGIAVATGDFFSFGDIFYEVTSRTVMRTIYGQPEHRDGIKIVGTKARDTQFKAKLIGPTDIKYADADAVQTTFHQQRGQAENADGPTGDVRSLQSDAVLGRPLTGAKEVSPKGDDDASNTSAFYDEEDA